MTQTTSQDRGWEIIESHLPKGFRELAVKMKLIQPRPKHLGTKVTDITQVLRLVLHHVSGASLRSTTAGAAAAQLVDLSAPGLHKWMCKLGPYLAALLAQVLETERFSPERWGGYTIIVGDATTVQRPGATGTTARVHYALRLAELSAKQCEVTDEKGGETARRFCAESGELYVLDRVYANPPGIAWLKNRGAEVLVRYNRGSLPLYDARGELLDVDTLVQCTLEFERAKERTVYVHAGDDVVIRGRLCWLRLPPEKAQQARERLRREAETPPDATALRMAEYVILFTTTPRDTLPTNLIFDLYRARWQIELDFKRKKSIGDLDKLPNLRPDTIHSWICANLLLQQIAHRIANSAVSFPPGGLQHALVPHAEAFAQSAATRIADRPRALVRDAPRARRSSRRSPSGQARESREGDQAVHRLHQAHP